MFTVPYGKDTISARTIGGWTQYAALKESRNYASKNERLEFGEDVSRKINLITGILICVLYTPAFVGLLRFLRYKQFFGHSETTKRKSLITSRLLVLAFITCKTGHEP